MGNPKIKIIPDTFDRVLDVISTTFAILIIGLPIYYFSELPELIPSHFNSEGIADDFKPKSIIFFLPSIGLISFIGLTILNKFPHVFNYPKKITEENAARQYKSATKFIRIINLLSLTSILYIVQKTVYGTINNTPELGAYFLPILLTFTIGVSAVYLYLAIRK